MIIILNIVIAVSIMKILIILVTVIIMMVMIIMIMMVKMMIIHAISVLIDKIQLPQAVGIHGAWVFDEHCLPGSWQHRI